MADFSWPLATGLFVLYTIIDGLYAAYTLAVQEHRAWKSATIAGLMYFVIALGTISYVKNYWYVLPIAIGSFAGTFIVVKRAGHRRPRSPVRGNR